MQTVFGIFRSPVRGEIAPGVPMPNVVGWPERCNQFVMDEFQPVQDVLVTVLAFGRDTFANDLLAIRVQVRLRF